jgi:hypothetical protein
MVNTAIVPTLRDLARMTSIGVHDPTAGTSPVAARQKTIQTAVGRFAHPKVPDGRIGNA